MRHLEFPSHAKYLKERRLAAAAKFAGFGALLVLAGPILPSSVSLFAIVFGFMFVGASIYPVFRAMDAGLGDRHESKIAEALSALDDRYLLVSNWVPVAGKGGDVDLLLLGPHGLLVIEAKNYTNDTKCEGDKWFVKVGDRGYWKPTKSVSQQLRGSVQRVKRALGPELKKSGAPVHGVIVFNDRATLDVGTCPEKLIRRREVLEYVRRLPEVGAELAGFEVRISGSAV